MSNLFHTTNSSSKPLPPVGLAVASGLGVDNFNHMLKRFLISYPNLGMPSSSTPGLPHPLPIASAMTQRPVILTFLVLILLRSRTISLSKDAIQVLRNAVASITNFGPWREKVDSEELDRVLQQVYIDEPDGSKTLLVPYRERIVKVCFMVSSRLIRLNQKGVHSRDTQIQICCR